MPTVVDCPSCGRKLKVPDSLAGQPVKCPSCQATFSGAGNGAAAPPAPPQEDLPEPRPRPPVDEDREDEEDRPWEQPGEIRRDSEPHRGPLLLILGIVSIVLGVFSIMFFCCIPVIGIVGLVGAPLGIVAWVLGQRDLRSMAANRMDARGKGLTHAGWVCGIVGTIVSAIGLVIMVAMIVFWGIMMATAATMPPPPPTAVPAVPPPPPPPPPRKFLAEVLFQAAGGCQPPGGCHGRECVGFSEGSHPPLAPSSNFLSPPEPRAPC
jgi:hypothetical protein